MTTRIASLRSGAGPAWMALSAFVAAGCGRIGFETTESASTATDGATEPAPDAADVEDAPDWVTFDGRAPSICTEHVAEIGLSALTTCGTCPGGTGLAQNTSSVQLSSGTYRLVPWAGAGSFTRVDEARWAWRLCTKIPSARFSQEYKTGNYATAGAALDAAGSLNAEFTVPEPAQVFFWFSDVKCDDNAGTLYFAICRVR